MNAAVLLDGSACEAADDPLIHFTQLWVGLNDAPVGTGAEDEVRTVLMRFPTSVVTVLVEMADAGLHA